MKKSDWLTLVFILAVMFAFIGASATGVAIMLSQERQAVAMDESAFGRGLDPLEPVWPEDPPIDFALVDHNGRDVDGSMLRGKVTVAMFTFTHCRGICSVMVPAMQELHNTLVNHPRKPELQLLNISIDPARDTVDRLGAWVATRTIDEDLYRFITDPTGQQDQIWTMCRERFRLTLEHTPENELMPFSHSPKFVLINPEGRIVGFYNGVDREARSELLRDINRLLTRKG